MIDNLDLAKRAVACKNWRWMPGMLAIVGAERQRVLAEKLPAYPDWIPDLTDAATLGCLLELVREAWGDPLLHVKGMWLEGSLAWTLSGHKKQQSMLRNIRLECVCDLEAEALVFALEAE